MSAIGRAGALEAVSIIGPGDFGCSLAARLLQNGFKVAVGSRSPGRRDLGAINPILAQARIVTIPECISFSDVVFVALHPDAHKTLGKYKQLLEGKILVDVSNAEKAQKRSNTEALAELLPGSRVVKGFNTVSAYALANETGDNRPVYVCGDDVAAKETVLQLASQIGFFPVNCGGLRQALSLEERNRELFPGWGWPSFVFFVIFLVWLTYAMVRYFYLKDPPYTWERLPLNVLNKVFGCTSINLLACAYLPGCFAAFTQLANGTKHKRFSKGLDRWLKMRKGLGLYALLCAVLHMMMSLALLSPTYFSGFYKDSKATIPVNRTEDTVINLGSRMNWNGETVVLFGFLAVFTMALQGLASIPSIASRLNWREWACVQTWIGFVCFVFAIAHVTIKSGPGWTTDSAVAIVQGLAFLALLLPWFTLALKFFLFLPCVYFKVKKIRQGWERVSDKDTEAARHDVPMTNYQNGSFMASNAKL